MPKAVKASKAAKTASKKAAAATTSKAAKKAAPAKATKAPAKAAKKAKKATATKVAPKAAKTPAKATKTAKAPAKAAKTPAKAAVKAAPAKAAPKKAAPAPAKAAPKKAGAAPAKAAPAKKAPTPPVKKAPGKVVLDKFVLEQRELLYEERRNHTEQADALRAEADALAQEMEPGDAEFGEEGGEGGTLSIDRERDLMLSAQARMAVEEIDAALAKIPVGTYGLCENCGKHIAKPRLKAIPYARLCMECKQGGLSRR